MGSHFMHLHIFLMWNLCTFLIFAYTLYNPNFYDAIRAFLGKGSPFLENLSVEVVPAVGTIDPIRNFQQEDSPRVLKTEGSTAWRTYEECYLQSDDTENCFYSGPVCYDRNSIFMITPVSLVPSPRSVDCFDARYQLPKEQCGLAPYFRSPIPANESLANLQDSYPSMPYRIKESGLGPLGFDAQIIGLSSEEFQSEFIYKGRVEWTDKSLYFVYLHYSWTQHIWHYSTAAMGLFDIKRHNRTSPETVADRNGFEGGVRDTRFVGGIYPAPPMDEVLFVGQYINYDAKPPARWIQGLTELLVQNHTNLRWTASTDPAISQDNVLCTNSAALVGLKPNLFTGRSDQELFRRITLAKLGIEPSPSLDPEWPPMKITLISRSTTRGIANIHKLVKILQTTGMDVEWVTDMGKLSSKEQVEVISRTGILISTHGAALTNLIWLPSMAAVIELFPYGMYASMYHDLAKVGNYFYHKVPSDRPPKEMASDYHTKDYISKCDGIGITLPSTYGYTRSDCNMPSKISPMVVNLDKFSDALDVALDEIGCRDRICYRNSVRISLLHRNASLIVQE